MFKKLASGFRADDRGEDAVEPPRLLAHDLAGGPGIDSLKLRFGRKNFWKILFL
jgi:hypothetical protein